MGMFWVLGRKVKTVFEDIEEYKRRSPVWNVEKLDSPLLKTEKTHPAQTC